MSILGALPTAALPAGPAYTVVLLCHVAAALVGMITMVAGIAFSIKLLAAGSRPVPAPVRSYFSPGTNWAGRALYLVPVLGAVLLGMSGGAYRLTSGWVLAGAGLWAASILAAELALWPAEQRVRRALAKAATEPEGPPPGATEPAELPEGATSAATEAARLVVAWSVVVVALLGAAMVVMVVKP